MQHLTLINTPLFQFLNQKADVPNLEMAYNEFVQEVWSICCDSENAKTMVLTMTYTEVELQHLLDNNSIAEAHREYIVKMVAFIRKTLERIRHYHLPIALPPPPTPNKADETILNKDLCQWNSNGIDLVELVYGLSEIGSINTEKQPLHLVVKHISSFFGIDIKDCYGAYVDMKQRKNDSRTYFLDKMRERLNQRMQRDDEKERMRK